MIKLVGGRSNNLCESETLNASKVSHEQHQFVVCVTICESLSDQTKVRVPLERVLDGVLLKRVPAERRRVRRRPRSCRTHTHSASRLSSFVMLNWSDTERTDRASFSSWCFVNGTLN